MAMFRVLYDGEALRSHAMEVRDLAPALLAIGDLLEHANLVLNGSKAAIRVKVNGSFKEGSFGINFEIGTLAQQMLSLAGIDGSIGPKEILALIGIGKSATSTTKTLIGLIKWIKGRPIKKIETLSNETVKICIDDSYIEVEQKILNLFRRHQVRKSLEAALKPLEKDGIDSFATTLDGGKTFETIQKEEVKWFAAPEPEDEMLPESIAEKSLLLVSVAFKEDNKWRFADGSAHFHAIVSDPEFMRAINNGEAFSKGDILRVKIKTIQYIREGQLQTEHEILKVIEHKRAPAQIGIPFKS